MEILLRILAAIFVVIGICFCVRLLVRLRRADLFGVRCRVQLSFDRPGTGAVEGVLRGWILRVEDFGCPTEIVVCTRNFSEADIRACEFLAEMYPTVLSLQNDSLDENV